MYFSTFKFGYSHCLYLLLVSVYKRALSMQLVENFEIGTCFKGHTDIIRIVDILNYCQYECKRRPSCTSMSYHRLTRFCRLHTGPSSLNTCIGHFYSEKSTWDMTDFATCTCAEGETCVKVEGNNNAYTCEVKECVMPDHPTNGKILGNDVSIGRRIRYICDQGYTANGNMIRECLETGIWSGSDPQCDPNTPTCSIGSTLWGTSCYFIATNTALKSTYTAAETYCQSTSAHVIDINSLEEQNYITSQLAVPSNPAATRYWTGMRSIGGEWVLSDGTSLASYFEWGPSQPGVDNCVVLKYDTSNWYWFTVDCSTSTIFPICEKEVV